LAIFLVITAIILIAVLIFLFSRKDKPGNWHQFSSIGKEAGFTVKELEQLRKIVTDCGINDPASIFKSQHELETVIRSTVKAVQLSGGSSDPETQFFLSKLFDYFKKIEMEASGNKTRITSSRQISDRQSLRILVTGTGVFKSEVLKNSGSHLTITRPVSAKSSAGMQWQNAKMSVYFWREEDAGYVFDTEVIDEIFSKGVSALKVEHNDSLFRTQKRKSLRLKYKKMAFLYPLDDADNPHRLEKSPGIKCMIEDISDTGCAFQIFGRADIGMRLKLQFTLDRAPVCIPATVRSVDYKENVNLSLVRMEADPLPLAVRNHILCEVFNMMTDDDDELPFRALEEEAGAVSASMPGSERQEYPEVVNV